MANVHSALSLGLWAFVIYRFAVVLGRGVTMNGEARRLAWLSWLAFFCVAMALTVYHPKVQAFISQAVGPWAGSVPRTIVATVGFLINAEVAQTFAPHARVRHDWLRGLGVLTLVTYVLVNWSTATGRLAVALPLASRTALADIFFDFYLLLLLTRVSGPAFAWAYTQERRRPMRLRFLVMLVMYSGIAAWMVTGIVEAGSDVLGFTIDYSPFYTALVVTLVPMFVAAHLLPVKYFVAGVRAVDYVTDLVTFLAVRLVEAQTAQWTGRPIIVLGGARHILRAPQVAVYRSLIACLDGRNLVKASGSPAARRLAQQLDWAARPELDYEETVARVRLIGFARTIAEFSRSLPDLVELVRSRAAGAPQDLAMPDFLGESIVAYLLQHYGVTRPPVPVEAMVQSPPADLAPHIHLAKLVPLGSTLSLLRLASAGPAAAADPRHRENEKRFALASALFVGLASTRRGRAIGWTTDIPLETLYKQASGFARRLLVPAALLPCGWESMSDEKLARLFAIPADVIQSRRADLAQPLPVAIPA
jgi:hypothetical protein